MKATFLVTLDVPSEDLLVDIAEEIQLDLSQSFDVESVKPWARDSLSMTQSANLSLGN